MKELLSIIDQLLRLALEWGTDPKYWTAAEAKTIAAAKRAIKLHKGGAA